MSGFFTEKEEEFLNDEMKEILHQLAVLLEMDTSVTAILLIESENTNDVYIASNMTSQVIRTRQSQVCHLIRNKSISESGWMFFFEVCALYIKGNLHDTMPKNLLENIYEDFKALIPVQELNNFALELFIDNLQSFILKSTDNMQKYHIKNTINDIKPQNLSFILLAFQSLFVNLFILRYFYHFKPENIAGKQKLISLQRRAKFVDKLTYVEESDGKHAETHLVEVLILKKIWNESGILLNLSPSKKFCLGCHSLLLMLDGGGIKISFEGMHNLDYGLEVSLPRNLNELVSDTNDFTEQLKKLKNDLKNVLAEQTKELPNFQCVSMFYVSELMKKTLSSKKL